MLFPKVLIISNKFDFASDFISVELNRRNVEYLRINRDELKDYQIEFNPLKPEIIGSFSGISFTICKKNLKSIYYRAPTFLRDIFQDSIDEEEQLIRTQWAAFVRSLCVFEEIKWLNNPTDIYKAEIKPYQLFLANKLGFNVPSTIISSQTKKVDYDFIAIKSIDTAIVSNGQNEGFVYTEIYKQSDIKLEKYSSPFFSQQGLVPKEDIRITVIDENVIAIKILGDLPIDVDWRKHKNELKYLIFDLPIELEKRCIQYVKELNLNFGAIDMAIHQDKYYFIEINPTGEWSWLQQNTGLKFDEIIVNSLIN